MANTATTSAPFARAVRISSAPELGLSGCDHLHDGHPRAPAHDLDLEALFLEQAPFARRVKSPEFRLRHPVEGELHLRGPAWRAARGAAALLATAHDRGGQCGA